MNKNTPEKEIQTARGERSRTAVFGGGCFWCTEAAFGELKGVISVTPGYAGGSSDLPPAVSVVEPPTYEAVSTGKTGYAEVVRVEYDPKVISYGDLLAVFFAIHDPTTLNRQGADIGSQYRSVIFYTNNEQEKMAQEFVENLKKSGINALTEIAPLDKFYEAEDYHKGYYKQNPSATYCQAVINPKLEKLQKQFQKLLKS